MLSAGFLELLAATPPAVTLSGELPARRDLGAGC
jgi:hypothetical protein